MNESISAGNVKLKRAYAPMALATKRTTTRLC